MRDDPLRLKDMLTAIDQILRYRDMDHAEFLRNELVQVWMVHHIQMIGEAARSLSDECRSEMPDVPWPKVVGMRHSLVHMYFQINLEFVWETATRDVPGLKDQILEYIRRKQIILP